MKFAIRSDGPLFPLQKAVTSHCKGTQLPDLLCFRQFLGLIRALVAEYFEESYVEALDKLLTPAVEIKDDERLLGALSEACERLQEYFGIPVIIVRRDLLPTSDSLVLLCYALQILVVVNGKEGRWLEALDKSEVEKLFGSVSAEGDAKVEQEMKNGRSCEEDVIDLPRCESCGAPVHVCERVVVESTVKHRRCFRCCVCCIQLRYGLFRLTPTGDYECLRHEHEAFLTAGNLSDTKQGVIQPQGESTSGCFADSKSLTSNKPTSGNLQAEPVTGGDNCQGLNQTGAAETTAVTDAADGLRESDDNVNEEYDVNFELSRLNESFNHSVSIYVTAAEAAERSVNTGPVPPVRKKHLKKLSAHRPEVAKQTADDDALQLGARQLEPDQYPAELNPFPDDSNEDTVTSSEYDDSLNPFKDDLGSDGESLSSQTTADDSHLADWPLSNQESSRYCSAPPSLRANATSSHDASVRDARRPCVAKLYKFRTAPPPPIAPKPSFSGNGARQEAGPVVKKKKRRAPPPPLPLRREIPCTVGMNEDEIVAALKSIDDEYEQLESYGRLIEQRVRSDMNQGDGWPQEAIVEVLYKLICKRIGLFSKEMELASCYRERQLNAIHSEVEFQLRCIVEKPEEIKTEEDAKKEAVLLQKLLKVIDEKSYLDETDSAFYSDPARVDHLQSILATSDQRKDRSEEKKGAKMQFGHHDRKQLLRRLKKVQLKLGHRRKKHTQR